MSSNHLRLLGVGLLLWPCGICLAEGAEESASSVLYDSVTVESRSFPPGHEACSIGVYIANSIPVRAMVLPFEFRSVSSGAFIASTLGLKFPVDSRLRNSSLGDVPSPDECPLADRILRLYPTHSSTPCDVGGEPAFGVPSAQVDFQSPDGVMYVTSCTSPQFLKDSTVPKPGVDTTPSAYLVFGVGDSVGTFVVDRSCMRPANVMLFADPDDYSVTPDFRLATITVECGPCRCHADPNCDGIISVVDVTLTINRALRGDELPCAPYVVGGIDSLDGPTDVNCSGATDIVDVVKAIGVAFRGLDPVAEFCAPCP